MAETGESLVESHEPSGEREQRIIGMHKGIVTSLLDFQALIEKDMPEKDQGGWRVYGFDAASVDPQKVQDISPGSEDIIPNFEIDFYPARADDTPQQSEPASVVIQNTDTGDSERAQLSIYPIGGSGDDITFTTLSVDLPTYLQSRITHPPRLISEITHATDRYDTQKDAVMTEGLSISNAQDGAVVGEDILTRMQQIASGLMEKRYHMRIFGNTRNSPLKPRFITQQQDQLNAAIPIDLGK